MALIKASPVGNRNYILLAAGEPLPVGRWVRVGADGRAYLASGAEDAPRGIGFVKETVLTVNEIVQVQVSGDLTLEAYDNAVPPNVPTASTIYYQADGGYLTAVEGTYPVAVGLPNSQVLIMAGGGGGGGKAQPVILEWQAATSYKANDLFYFGNVLYRVLSDHTSASAFAPADIGSKYEVVVLGQFFDAWVGGLMYVAGTCVVVGNKVYVCTTNHTALPSTFDADIANWRLLFEFATADHTHSQYYSGSNFESLARISHDLENWPTWMGEPWPGSRGCSVRRLSGTGTVVVAGGDLAVQFLNPMADIVANYDENDYLADVTVMVQAVTDSQLVIKHSATLAVLDSPRIAAGDTAVFKLKNPEVILEGTGNFSYAYVVEVVYWLGGRADIKRKTFTFEGVVAEGGTPVQIFDCAAWTAIYIDTPDYYMRATIELESMDSTDQTPLSYVLSYNSLDMLAGVVTVAIGAEIVNPAWDSWKLRVISGQYRIKVVVTYIC